MDFYVYYKVAPDAAVALAPRVKLLQQQLAASHGVVTALKRRPGEQNGMQTWMEVYTGAPSDFAALLDLAVQQSGIAACANGGRHTEIFMDLEACA
ncbi:DUF4936 family protein [Noviherbaspirillum soli]|uniref:DUF4936 family protein n=1 Tax=Noviherbaspirillum soli TaxID=1064518 RepID=UPI001889CB3E|nr:DUF4936 family protein [Noviherbaspirillum soli]